ncbi:MAG: alkaline phosphatase family protein, partial [Sphingobacterium sp.]
PTPDVTHRFYHNKMQINGGKMDKFALYNDSKGLAMGYYNTKKIPLYPIAQKYTLCDNFFQSVYGGSYFNHVYLISAAVPVWPNAPESMIAKLDAEGNMVTDGIVTPDGYVVNHVLSRNFPYPVKSDTTKLLPSQTMPTIGDRLSEKDISWTWYSEGWDDAVAGRKNNFAYNHEPFLYFANYEEGTEGRKHMKDQNDFIKAAKEGTLPSVSFVKPGGGNDEHPGASDVYSSEELAVNLINSVLEGPNGQDALVILTYDEFGGFFDHVNPPEIDRWGPGSRIPAIVIGPFAKKGVVDHTQYETVSILSFIEHRWGIEPLAERDKNANPFRNALIFK